MSIMTYLILFLVAGYLFRVNPVLCVGLVGAVVFFKVRGYFGSRKSQSRSGGSAASEAALVAMCITLLERSERKETPSYRRALNAPPRDEDPLEGLFLD